MSLDLSDWMDLVKGSTQLSELSIPGSHDSGAKDPQTDDSEDRVRLKTQDRTILEQLSDGIRFLDIRARYIRGEFQIYHEGTFLNLSFRQVLDDCKTFLAAHPRETIIMSIKEESTQSENDPAVSYYGRFLKYVADDRNLFSLANADIRLSKARGRIVLFRRFPLDANSDPSFAGINAYPFEDGTTFDIAGPPMLKIQDRFSLLLGDLEMKWGAIESLLNRASGPSVDDKNTLFVNFVSGAGIVPGTFPEDIAKFENAKLIEYFNKPQHKQGRFGIVLTDFERPEINRLIVRTNLPLDGYWIVDENARVTAIGTAADLVASGTATTNAIAIGARNNGTGYYVLSLDGTVRAYGTATLATGESIPKGTQAVSIAVRPTSKASTQLGYWILSLDGKVFAYNAQKFDYNPPKGGANKPPPNLQTTSIVATPTGDGYWILASDGAVYAYGAAKHHGDRKDSGQINVGMARTKDGGGYWILTSKGKVTAFGNAAQLDSGVNDGATARAIAAKPDGTGYWILSTDGNIHAYGGAHFVGRATSTGAFVGLAPAPA